MATMMNTAVGASQPASTETLKGRSAVRTATLVFLAALVGYAVAHISTGGALPTDPMSAMTGYGDWHGNVAASGTAQ